jgi:DNA-directed RNA polymerase subunit RPC12/RpoP
MRINPKRILKKKPQKCPKCGHSPVAEILYGMPAYDDEMADQVQAGKLYIAGCMFTIPHTHWKCSKCKREFYAQEDMDQWKSEGYMDEEGDFWLE